MRELLIRQAQLNAALDLDKNEAQAALPAEDDIGLPQDHPQLVSPPKLQRVSAPHMTP